jgi:triosephosphate isomerase
MLIGWGRNTNTIWCSVSASNCGELFKIKDINGALVGGASLKPADFKIIVKTASKIVK